MCVCISFFGHARLERCEFCGFRMHLILLFRVSVSVKYTETECILRNNKQASECEIFVGKEKIVKFT